MPRKTHIIIPKIALQISDAEWNCIVNGRLCFIFRFFHKDTLKRYFGNNLAMKRYVKLIYNEQNHAVGTVIRIEKVYSDVISDEIKHISGFDINFVLRTLPDDIRNYIISNNYPVILYKLVILLRYICI